MPHSSYVFVQYLKQYSSVYFVVFIQLDVTLSVLYAENYDSHPEWHRLTLREDTSMGVSTVVSDLTRSRLDGTWDGQVTLGIL